MSADFIHNFTDAYRLLRECELPMSAQQLSDELEWSKEKRAVLTRAAKGKDLPLGIRCARVNGVIKFGVVA